MTLEFRRLELQAEILDPRHGFERRLLPLEVRWDPLTGESCRLLPPGSLQPPAALDLAELDERSRPGCPFCGDLVEETTPRFPPEIWPEGRIRSGEAVLFPNLVPYAKWSSVSIYSPLRHRIGIAELDAAAIADNLRTQVLFVRAVQAHDPGSEWASINANHLPPSGSSIFHPHLQGSANPTPTTAQRGLREIAPARLREYVEAEVERGERRLGSTGTIDWLASFAPAGLAEVRAFAFDAGSPAELADDRVEEIALGVALVLGLYDELGFQSFNLAIDGAAGLPGGFPLRIRLVARAVFGPLGRSDVMWSERLHAEAAVDHVPEELAERGRRRFSGLPQ